MSKHAYLIMAHSDIALLRVLIAMLDYRDNDIYLHVDKKWTEFDVSSLQVRESKLYVLPKRIDAAWGHSSLVDVEFLLFETALKQGKYDYFHLLSGADLPIKSQDYIHQFFEEHQGFEFVSFWLAERSVADARYKVERYHYGMRLEKKPLPRFFSVLCAKLRFLISDALYTLFGARKFPWEFVKGGQWISVSLKVVETVIANKELVKQTFVHTRAADEIFVQAIMLSTPALKERVYSWESGDSAAMRETMWDEGANSPKVFTMKDKELLLNSPNLFARKFSSSVDMDVIRLIESTFKN